MMLRSIVRSARSALGSRSGAPDELDGPPEDTAGTAPATDLDPGPDPTPPPEAPEEGEATAAPADQDGPAIGFGPVTVPARSAALLEEADRLVGAGDVFGAIDLLTAANREERDAFVEHRLVHLRHEAVADLETGPGRAEWPPVVPDRFEGETGVPTIDAADLDADAVASAVTHHGCLHVRGLLSADDVDRLVADIDQAFTASLAKAYAHVGTPLGSWYQPFRPSTGAPPVALGHRWWVQEAGGVLAADSPPAFFTMTEIFAAAGLREVVAGYLGEPPVFSLDKVTLRRVPLDLNQPEWHQDGRFLGEGIRVLNVWVALTACGGRHPSPGLEVVPKRIDHLVATGTEGAHFDWAVGHDEALRAAAGTPLLHPEFEAGDVLLFDELFLHRTWLDASMTEERYAIESWFFAPSSYPGKNAPLVF